MLLDSDLSSHALVRILSDRGCDVKAAGLDPELRQADDRVLFAAAQAEGRIMITHNSHDFPAILREWAESGRTHAGCIVSFLPTNSYGEMQTRFDRWFGEFPRQADRAAVL